MPREETGLTTQERRSGWVPTSLERSVLGTLNEMERMFEEAVHRPFFGFNWRPFHALQGAGSYSDFSPAVDIFDEGNHIVVKSELPGMTKNDINIEVMGNTLCISGEKKSELKVDQTGYFRAERSFGQFRRNLTLPEGIDYRKVKANFKDGILEVRIPKSENKESARRIPIE
jgi:HSP20 family protein